VIPAVLPAVLAGKSPPSWIDTMKIEDLKDIIHSDPEI